MYKKRKITKKKKNCRQKKTIKKKAGRPKKNTTRKMGGQKGKLSQRPADALDKLETAFDVRQSLLKKDNEKKISPKDFNKIQKDSAVVDIDKMFPEDPYSPEGAMKRVYTNKKNASNPQPSNFLLSKQILPPIIREPAEPKPSPQKKGTRRKSKSVKSEKKNIELLPSPPEKTKKKQPAVVDLDEMFQETSPLLPPPPPEKIWKYEHKEIPQNKNPQDIKNFQPLVVNSTKRGRRRSRSESVDDKIGDKPADIADNKILDVESTPIALKKSKIKSQSVINIDDDELKPPPFLKPAEYMTEDEMKKRFPIFDDDYWLNVYDEYLKDVLFGEENEKELKNEIMEKSFGPNTYFVDLFQNIESVLPDFVESVLPEKEENKKWVDCVNECFSQTHDNVMQEIGSTAYMLRVLTKSVVGDTKNNKIVFSLDNKENLTGKWENDKEYFKMKIERLDGSRKVCKGRLIMGFGPSASGKTYCANKVIELMSSIDNEFPKFFITVDGGVFREESVVYQTIIKAVGEKGAYDGLTNLVSASALSLQQSIFESNIIKKTMKQYLREQKENNKFVVSLYVPETLGGCIRNTVFTMVDCSKSYKDYIDITNDKDWIGLMIYQHKEHSDCPYKKDYKCKGTTESGQSREITEGKKYSSSAWDNSYKNGNYSIAQAETYRFRIHNSGRRDGITVFEDLSPKKIDISNQTISKFFKDSNWQYVDDKVKFNNDCEKYSNKCSKAKKRSNSDSSE